ncbi:hypothetical protein OUZ56_029038 [Daphnia magna]|uniref:Uncharacterized protein n=1 Tax=Daphnia magna TaxID=35525 RepID=A0ABR0B5N4_9CRUS|nr:hypothetical protein OUZ56_029038 [Daphnia magna]
MISLEGEEATHKSELTVNRSRKNLSETFHPLPASLSHAPGNLPGESTEVVALTTLVDAKDSVGNRTFILHHDSPMLNHRAISHISTVTVLLCHLRLQVQLDGVKHGRASIRSQKTTMI